MPNCNWFATLQDHMALLDQIFDRGGIELYELFSRDGHKLRCFHTPAEVAASFNEPLDNGAQRTTFHLNIRVLEGSPRLDIEKSTPSRGTWSERSGAMGFVQFKLAREQNHTLDYSAANTVTPTRMGAVNGIFTDHTGTAWDIAATNHYSAWLNRTIRKAGVAKMGAVTVLPNALQVWDKGGTLWQANKLQQPDALVRS